MRLNKYLINILDKKYPNWDISIALRYLPIVRDIRKNFGKNIKILDVGSGDSGLYTYLRGNYEVTATDIEIAENINKKVKMVKASADSLPFKSHSFDVVVSVDMMEHLPVKIRQKAIQEMIRVAKDRLYISFPRGKFSTSVDKFLSKYYLHTHKKKLEFLEEHIGNGLPDTNQIDKYITGCEKKFDRKIIFFKRGNTNIFLWAAMLLLGFSENKYFTNIYSKLLFLLPLLDKLNWWPTYRVLYVVKLDQN